MKVLVTFSEDISVISLVETLAEEYDMSAGVIVAATMTVTVGGRVNNVLSSSYSGRVLTLNLESPNATSSHTVTVAHDNVFAVDAGGLLVDSAGNALATFGAQTVTNASIDTNTPLPFFEPTSSSVTSLHICEGGSGTYGVTLPAQPDEDVVVTVEAWAMLVSVSPDTMTFTDENWNVEQYATVSAEVDTYSHSAWGVATYEFDGVPAAQTYDNLVRVVVRDQTHADCSS